MECQTEANNFKRCFTKEIDWNVKRKSERQKRCQNRQWASKRSIQHQRRTQSVKKGRYNTNERHRGLTRDMERQRNMQHQREIYNVKKKQEISKRVEKKQRQKRCTTSKSDLRQKDTNIVKKRQIWSNKNKHTAFKETCNTEER